MKNRLRRVAWTGCLVWLLGSLWSAESAAYCTAIWIPAYALILWEWFGRRDGNPRRPVRRVVSDAIPWLLIPPVLMLSAVALLSAYYLLRLGHLPDFTGFFDAALAFTSGFNVKPIDPAGNGWVLVLIFCVVSTFAAHLLCHGERFLPSLSVASGIFGAVWATGSYFVSHSHGTQILNLAPIYCASIGILLLVFSRYPSQDPIITLMKIAITPVLTVVIFSTFGNHSKLSWYLQRSYIRYTRDFVAVLEVDQLIAFETSEMHELLDRAGVRAGDRITSLQRDLLGRIAYHGDDGAREVRSEHPTFLPIKPTWALAALEKRRHRIEKLLGRWIFRYQPSGWLLVPKQNAFLPWVVETLDRTHTATEEFSNRKWRLIRMEFKGEVLG
jgi:hypothetical protein